MNQYDGLFGLQDPFVLQTIYVCLFSILTYYTHTFELSMFSIRCYERVE